MGVASIVGAGISILAWQRSRTRRAPAILARIADRTEVAVVAWDGVWGVNTARLEPAAIGRAQVIIVAHDVRPVAGSCRAAIQFGACIAVVTVQRVWRVNAASITTTVVRAWISVIAD